MSESNQPEKSPTGSAPSSQWDSVTDKELDQALSKASDLAEQLVDQLGRPEAVETPPPNPLEDQRGDIDAELGRVAELTQAASQEIQESPPPAPSESKAVPDFMSEFMEPPVESPPEPAPGSIQREGDSSEDDLTAATVSATAPSESAPMGVVGGVINITLPAGKLRKQAEAERNAAGSTQEASPRPGLVSKALNPIAATLEAVDRPFARLNSRARSIAGWLGFALLVTSGLLMYWRLG